MDPFGSSTEQRIGRRLWLDYHLSPRLPACLNVLAYERPMPLEVDFHEGIEVGILLSGAQERSFEQFAFPALPGDAWLCSSWEPHGWQVLAAGTTAVVVVFLPGFVGDEMLGKVPWLSLFATAPGQRPQVRTQAQRQRLLRIAEDWREEWRQRSPEWATAVRLGLLNALFTLGRGWTPRPLPSGTRRSLPADLARIMPALRLVHGRPTRKVPLPEAAAACHLSRGHFCLVFRRAMGEGFGDFCNKARLGLAAQQLLSSDATVEAIAGAVGFADGSHLHRSFVKRYGCTPGQFRDRRHPLPGPAPVVILNEV